MGVMPADIGITLTGADRAFELDGRRQQLYAAMLAFLIAIPTVYFAHPAKREALSRKGDPVAAEVRSARTGLFRRSSKLRTRCPMVPSRGRPASRA